MAKNKKKKFIWKKHDVKIALSEPCIEAEPYSSIKNEEEIQFFYYALKVFAKKPWWKKKKKKWNLVAVAQAFDFPSIFQLRESLRVFINNEVPIENYSKTQLYHRGEPLENAFSYEYHIENMDGFPAEDCFDVAHIIFSDDGDTHDSYTLSIGGSNRMCGSRTAINVSACMLNKEDIKELYDMIDEFVQFAVAEYNRTTKEENDRMNNSFYKKGDFVYHHKPSEQPIDIYKKGDIVETITALSEDSTDENFCAVEYKNCRINSITSEGIDIIPEGIKTDGYNATENTEQNTFHIPFSRMLYIWSGINDEILQYDEKTIAEDFASIMDDRIKEDFKEMPECVLNDMYRGILISRYTMCREEHPYMNNTHDKECVYAAVKNVISILKNHFSEENN